MIVLALIVLLILISWRLNVHLFEFVFGLLLVVPLLWFLGARVLQAGGLAIDATGAASLALYLGSFALVIGAAIAFFGVRRSPRRYNDLYPLGAFFIFFSIAWYLCSLWPDFIAMGERLRDYAILASVVHSPVVPNEPWMDGATLNYYVYWYRFGAMLRALLRIEVWQIYHILVAFSIAFYGAVVFQMVRVIVGASALWAAVSSIVIAFGSNYAGFRLWRRNELGGFERDDGWWGPSRVVQGAINEFPAWSFLLGDAHPHYLNIAALPFLFLILYRIGASQIPCVARLLQGTALVLAGALFLLGSNAWEVPMWLGLACVLLVIYGVHQRSLVMSRVARLYQEQGLFEVFRAFSSISILLIGCTIGVLQGDSLEPVARVLLVGVSIAFGLIFFPYKKQVIVRLRAFNKGDAPIVISAIFWIVLLIALWLSSRHIIPEGGALKLVRAPIAVTTTPEIFIHWGFHLSVIIFASLLLMASRALIELLLSGALLVLAGLYDKGALVVFALIGFQLIGLLRLSQSGEQSKGKSNSRSVLCRNVYVDTLLLAALGLILIPEIVFLDDPYGGENERMNTIFKIYEAAWGLLGIGAVGILHRALNIADDSSGRRWLVPGLAASSILIVCCLSFLVRSIPLRVMAPSDLYGMEGLAAPDREHDGAGAAIRALRGAPRGRVLEAQGNAYSYTAFVSTLAGQPSYLGWANHVNLLTRQYQEVEHRERMTDQIYSEPDCLQRTLLAQREKISYIVIGKLEEKRYPGIRMKDFSCFRKVIGRGGYNIYATGS